MGVECIVPDRRPRCFTTPQIEMSPLRAIGTVTGLDVRMIETRIPFIPSDLPMDGSGCYDSII